MKSGIPSEADEQRAVVEWLKLQRVRFFHVPNGGYRNWKTARALKRIGTQKGVPDLWIVSPPPRRPGRIGTVIEMKRHSGGTLSPEQREWLHELDRLSWCCLVCHGAGEAIQALQTLGYQTTGCHPRIRRRNRDCQTA